MQNRIMNIVKTIVLVTIIVSGFLAVLLVFTACEDDYHPTGAINGKVYSAVDSTVIENASVSIVTTDYSTATDADGAYLLQSIPEGLYTVMAEAEGFRTGYAYTVEVWANDLTKRDLYLPPE